DTDAAFDDLAAILMVAASEQFDIQGISLVAGVADLDTVIDNARRMAALFGWPYPMFSGEGDPLAVPLVTADYVLGPTGILTAGRYLPEEKSDLAGTDGVAAMLEWLRAQRDSSAVMLALGPLTNLARAIGNDPTAFRHIHEIVLMGGSTDRGNHTAAAEFNIAVDPEAAAMVFEAGVPIRMVGLNACRDAVVHPSDVADLRAKGSEKALILADLLAGYISIRMKDDHKPVPMPLYDPVAAAALIDPGSVDCVPARVDVECKGQFTRGMTVCEFRVPNKGKANAGVAVSADGERVRELLFRAFDRNT
ncbi:MAG: nucleoside hydrolase, partial [Rhodospirillales bacterium]|nr:nucleoside hydrolase [Rhodospirillales bacterium]